MRVLKPLLAGAALLTLAAPALASAEPYYGDHAGYDHGYAAYDRGDYGRDYRYVAPRWAHHHAYRFRRDRHDRDWRYGGWDRGWR